MIQPRPVRSCLKARLRHLCQQLLLLVYGAAIFVWFCVKLAGPSSEGNSVEQCRPTQDKGVKHVKGCSWDVGLLSKDKMVTYLRSQRLRSAILN